MISAPVTRHASRSRTLYPQGVAALEMRNVYRFFHAGDEETLALRGVSLSVLPGEFVVVTGPSGSGKSTLIACSAGLDDPDGGSVHVGGRPMSRRPEVARAELRRTYLGVLGQTGNLFGHLTVGENVRLTGQLRADDSSRASAESVMEDAQILHRKSAYPDQLSGGETSRAGLAVALANQPILLLADEPTGELDLTSEAAMLGLLREQAARGMAVLIASHSPAVAAAASRVLSLRDGTQVTDESV